MTSRNIDVWPSKVYFTQTLCLTYSFSYFCSYLRIKMLSIFIFLLSFQTIHSQMYPPMISTRFGEKYDEALEAIFSIAVRLEALLSDTGTKTSENFMVSPLNMALGVGELLLGARGSFQDELYQLLTIDGRNTSSTVRHQKSQDIKYISLHEQLGDLLRNLKGNVNNYFELKTASVLFVQKDMSINNTYKQNVAKYYGTNVEQVDFVNDFINTEQIINKWASDNTNGLIKKILPEGLSPKTIALLANAVYFKADWQVPFSSEINRILSFKTTANSLINTTFMMGEFDDYKYVENKRLGCRMVSIPYKNNELSMNIVLPNENNGQEYNINKFVSNLRTKDIVELINTAQTRKVFMLLPKMELTNTVKVLGPLRQYHSYKNHVELQKKANLFSGDDIDRLNDKVNFFKNISSLSTTSPSLSLDLSGISPSEHFHLGELVQQTILAVHEFGTEAASVSASAIDYILDSVTFRVDRPFLFFIRHEQTEATLFWGTIQNPTETKH